MWFLRSQDGKEFFLLPGKSYIVGRKDVDIVLEGDASISRKHAALSVSRNSKNSGCVVTLSDLKSKYGIFRRKGLDKWERILPEHEVTVGNREVIRFGMISQIWTVKKCVVSPSNLTNTQKNTLTSTLASVGAEYSAGWTEHCTHLTMNSVTMTVKAVCALALGVPIVTPDYWRWLDHPAGKNCPFKLPKDHIPPFGERTLDASRFSLDVHEGRRLLFAGMRFVFANQEQLKKKGCLVTSAGGEAVAYDARTFSFKQLCEPHTVLVNFFSNETQELLAEFTAAIAYSEKHGRRKIPESEIGLAILDCSIERHCNPLYRPVASLLQNIPLESQTQLMAQTSQILAFETQDSQDISRNGRNISKSIVIPESGSSSKNNKKNGTQEETQENVPIPVGPTDREKRSRKRQGDSQIEEPRFKKPAAVVGASSNLFSGGASIVEEDTQESKESLRLELGDGLGYDENEDPFNFSKSTRSRSSRKRAGSTQDDDDLFGSLESNSEPVKIKEEVPTNLELEKEDEDMFGEEEIDNVQIGSNASVMPVDNSSTGRKSRKVIIIDETNGCEASTSGSKFVQKSLSMKADHLQKNEVASDNEKSDLKLSKVSMNGFLSAMKVKKCDPDDMDDLEDAIQCLVEVEITPLVVRKPSVSIEISVSDSAPINFKRFHKVMPVITRRTIALEGSSDFNTLAKSESDLSEEEDEPIESQQCFDFVVKKRKR